MADNVLFVGWNRPIPGYEQKANALFGEYMQYLGGLTASGRIASFEPVLLQAHGGDLNGFVILHGDATQLAQLQGSDEFDDWVARAGLVLDGLGVIGGVTGDALLERVARFQRLTAG